MLNFFYTRKFRNAGFLTGNSGVRKSNSKLRNPEFLPENPWFSSITARKSNNSCFLVGHLRLIRELNTGYLAVRFIFAPELNSSKLSLGWSTRVFAYNWSSKETLLRIPAVLNIKVPILTVCAPRATSGCVWLHFAFGWSFYELVKNLSASAVQLFSLFVFSARKVDWI